MMARGAQRRLAAIMFTDIVGYSALTQKNESLALELLEEHRKLLRSIFPQYGGKEIETIGDAFLVEFGSALEATRCAIEMQKTLIQQYAMFPPEKRVQIRIGIHLGDVIHRENQIFGDGVNIASRIEPLADAGGICISEDMARQIQNKVEEPVLRTGVHKLKNIQLPVEVYKIVLPWAVTEEASSRTTRLRVQQDSGRLVGIASSETPDQPSIAVLPFVNMSSDPENEYFSDGLTEELTNALSRVEGLHVVARTSAFHFKGRTEDIREIGEQLNVCTILEGSARKAGNRIRVTAQLVNVADGYHLWSERYDRKMNDIFDIQDEITEHIVDKLTVKLTGRQRERLVKRYTDNIEAYNFYLKGLYYWNRRTAENFRKAIEAFERAVEKDPNYALAHAGLADAYALLGIAEYGVLNPEAAMSKAKAAALKTLDIDKNLTEPLTTLGHIAAFYDWDWANAETKFRQAIELNPKYAMASHWYALYLAAMERHDEALAQQRRALELDPLSLIISKNVGTILYFQGRYDEAIEQYFSTLELDPNFVRAYFYLGLAYQQKKMFKEAVSAFKEATRLSADNSVCLAMLGQAYAVSNQIRQAKTVLEKLQVVAKQQYVPSLNIAFIYLGLHELDQTFVWLERAVQERSSWLVSLKVEPLFDPIRSDPRYKNLLHQVGLVN